MLLIILLLHHSCGRANHWTGFACISTLSDSFAAWIVSLLRASLNWMSPCRRVSLSCLSYERRLSCVCLLTVRRASPGCLLRERHRTECRACNSPCWMLRASSGWLPDYLVRVARLTSYIKGSMPYASILCMHRKIP